MNYMLTPHQVAREFQMQMAIAMKCSALRGEMSFVWVPRWNKEDACFDGIEVRVNSLGAVGIVSASDDELRLYIEEFSERCVLPLIDKLMSEHAS